MKALNNPYNEYCKTFRRVLGGIFSLVVASTAVAGEKQTVAAQPGLSAVETEMDIPTDFHRYYGQRVNMWKDTERKVAKVDMDADLNMDGVISNSDPADGGAFEGTPPGLQIGRGEMTKVIVRVSPYRIEYQGEVVIGLEVAGINRAVRSGQFASFDEEAANVGRVRVWADADRTQLLLDSANQDKRYVEWTTQFTYYPYNLPGDLPRVVYVEGVKPSTKYSGDLRLLLTCAHRKPGSSPQQFSEHRKALFKSYRTTFDHILITVVQDPLTKDFVNNNVEGVWMTVRGSSK